MANSKIEERKIKLTIILSGRSEGQDAISFASGYGPTFGSGKDLFISSDSNINKTSYSNKTSYDLNNYLDGSRNFQTVEIEIFQVI